MSLVRRCFAALSGLFLLQFMLLGSGTLCAMHDDLSPRAESARAMAMASMAPQAAFEAGAHASVVSNADDMTRPSNPVDCNGSTDHDGCGLPFAPGQCSTMMTCGVSATRAAPIEMSEYAHVVALELPLAALAQSGPTFAPELPPPRA